MDKKSNDINLDALNRLTNGQIFFAQRWWELLDNGTHENHHLRSLNLHGSLIELLNVCRGVLDKTMYKWHLQNIVNETRALLKSDPVIQNQAKSYFNMLIKALNAIPNQDNQVYKLAIQLKYAIHYIKQRYLKWVIIELAKQIKGNDLEKIDKLVNCLVSELIQLGWSTHSLYSIVNKADFYKQNYWRSLLFGFLRKKDSYYCMIKVTQEVNENYLKACELVDLKILKGKDILESFPAIQVSEETYYYTETVNALDLNSAMDLCMQEYGRKIDMLKFYGYRIPPISSGSIFLPSNNKFYPNVKLPKFKSMLTNAILEKPLEIATKLNEEPSTLLQRVYRYYRQAEESSSEESCFLNIWVALESFTKTNEYSDNESDFSPIRDNVSAVVASGYIFNLVRYFLADCLRCDIDVSQILTLTGNTHKDTANLLSVLLDSTKNTILKQECERKNTLLGYRCEVLITLLSTPQNVKNKLKEHHLRVQYHLQRIYRVRNSIVHSANHGDNNLELLIKHLNSYLKSSVNVCAYHVKNNEARNFDEAFVLTKQNYDATIEILDDNTLISNKRVYKGILIDGALLI
jgi:hypothetical protein